MPANREPLHEASDRHSYYYRRPLTPGDYLLATGVGLGVGLAAFYLATRFVQRTPLIEDPMPGTLRRKGRTKGSEG